LSNLPILTKTYRPNVEKWRQNKKISARQDEMFGPGGVEAGISTERERWSGSQRKGNRSPVVPSFLGKPVDPVGLLSQE